MARPVFLKETTLALVDARCENSKPSRLLTTSKLVSFDELSTQFKVMSRVEVPDTAVRLLGSAGGVSFIVATDVVALYAL